MKRTMLYNWHKARGARIVEFAGWEMPIQYTTISEEHQAVREKAGLFDLGHMGRIRIRGKDQIPFVQYVFTNDVESMRQGCVQYGFLCNPHGGVIDDVMVYLADDYIMLVVNASNTDKVMNWLRTNAANFQVEIEDVTIPVLMLAIQGPCAEEILSEAAKSDFSTIAHSYFEVQYLLRTYAVISRTGYTGEDGFEIYVGAIYFQAIWEHLLTVGEQKGLVPVGLGARDTLRTEACLPLYGHELTEETTPFDAGLGKFVKLSKLSDFIGKKALHYGLQAEFARRLVCFEMLDTAIPRKDHVVMFNDLPIGVVTSGTFSPTLNGPIALAFVEVGIPMGAEVQVRIRGTDHAATLTGTPFYDQSLFGFRRRQATP